MFSDLWSISKTQAVAANFAWWIPACFLTDLLISVIKTNVFCNKAAEKDPAFVINEWISRWHRLMSEKQEMRFLSFCTYCHLFKRESEASCSNVQQCKPQQQMFRADNGHSRVLKTFFFKQISKKRGHGDHLRSLVSQFCDTLLKNFCRRDARKTSRKTNKR